MVRTAKKGFHYLGKEHSFVHVAARQSHCPSEGLEDTQGRIMPLSGWMFTGFLRGGEKAKMPGMRSNAGPPECVHSNDQPAR